MNIWANYTNPWFGNILISKYMSSIFICSSGLKWEIRPLITILYNLMKGRNIYVDSMKRKTTHNKSKLVIAYGIDLKYLTNYLPYKTVIYMLQNEFKTSSHWPKGKL